MKIVLSKSQWEQIGTQTGWLIKEAQERVPNNPIHGKRWPWTSQEWIFNQRLFNQTRNPEGGFHHKEYTVRVYRSDRMSVLNEWEVWAFSGAINGTLKPQPKGVWSSERSALNTAERIIAWEMGRGYRTAEDALMPTVNTSIPGRLAPAQPSLPVNQTRQKTSIPPSPKPTPKPPEPSKPTPPPDKPTKKDKPVDQYDESLDLLDNMLG